MTTVTKLEQTQVEKANASGKRPVVFVHGLWLLPTSWDRWAKVFEGEGFAALSPGWPDDPDTVAAAREHPEVMAKKSIKDVADHYDEVIRGLKRKPAVVGHSFGGLMTEILAGRGLSKVSVAISPAPFRGVLPLPISALRSGSPVLRNPGIATAPFPSRSSSSSTRSPTRSAKARRSSCTTRSAFRLRVSRSSRRRPPT
jgi:non-heme chloroperoxidase